MHFRDMFSAKLFLLVLLLFSAESVGFTFLTPLKTALRLVSLQRAKEAWQGIFSLPKGKLWVTLAQRI